MRLLFLLLLTVFLQQARAQRADTAAYPASDSLLYIEEAVELHTATGTLYGTLTVPHRKEAVPVALIIAGSGPTDRDGNSAMLPGKNNSLRYLAHQLAKQNIASLRFDKRGAATGLAAMKSEADLRFDDLVSDARGWIELLRKQGRFTRLYIIGHSEGSLVGLAAAQRVDGLVSIAGAGFPADEILRRQLAPLKDSLRQQAYLALDTLRSGQLLKRPPIALISLFRPSVQPYLVSWFRYDPRQLIAGLKMPLLILQGDNDLQVTVSDAQSLKAAAPGARLLLVPHMNHVLKETGGGQPENIKAYSDPSLRVSPALLSAIGAFINRKK